MHRHSSSGALWLKVFPLVFLSWQSLSVAELRRLFLQTVSMPKSGEPKVSCQFWARVEASRMWKLGAAKAKGAAKAVGGVRGKAPVSHLSALTPRHPAVAKPEGDAKRKAAPKGGVAKPAGMAKAKGKAPAGFACGRGMAVGSPVLTFATYMSACYEYRVQHQHPQLYLQSLWDLHQVWLRQRFIEVHTQLLFHPCQEESSHHPVVTSIPAPTSNFTSDASRWFHLHKFKQVLSEQCHEFLPWWENSTKFSQLWRQHRGHLSQIDMWHSTTQMRKYQRTRGSTSEKTRNERHLENGHHGGDRNKSQRETSPHRWPPHQHFW